MIRGTAIPDHVRNEVLARDNYQCVVCGVGGDNRLQLHHWQVSRAQGGDNSPANLATLCHRCHWQVHARLIELFYLQATNGQWCFFVRRLYHS